MGTSKINEQAFEALIEKALVGTTLEERQQTGATDVDKQQPAPDQYYWGQPKDMTEKKYAFDMRRLWSFLETTQQDILDEYKGKDIRTELPKQLSKAIDTFGIIHVLRKGVDIDNIHLTLFYPKPSKADSELSRIKYAQNQFSITRQQTYSVLHPGDEIDMVLYVNNHSSHLSSRTRGHIRQPAMTAKNNIRKTAIPKTPC